MWSMKPAVGLVCVVVALVVAGCSSGGAGGSTTSSVAAERELPITSTSGVSTGAAGTSTASTTFVISSPADPGMESEAWKSDVIVKISQDLAGGDADGAAGRTTISDDGRYVAFESNAADMVPGDGDTNRSSDVFPRDRQTGITRLVSAGPDGKAVGGGSARGVSADGRIVAFQSEASDLVPGDTNGAADIFVRNLETGTTQRVNPTADGTQAHDRSPYVALSGDGRWVALMSHANDLVPGDKKRTSDVFVAKAER